MNLFIDTSSLLAYFIPDAKDDSLVLLKKTLEKRRGKQKKNKRDGLHLIVTEQSIQEFKRGVVGRVNEECQKIEKNQRAHFNYPEAAAETSKGAKKKDSKLEISTHYPDEVDSAIKAAKEKIDQANKLIEKYYEEKHKTFLKEVPIREKLIYDILKLGQRIPYSDEIFARAEIRHIKGNPPKKNNDGSYGDAINWESLLKYADSDDLVLISKDGDFSEEYTDVTKIRRFLMEEWETITGKKIELHDSLGEFINKFVKTKAIKEEVIQEEKELTENDLLQPLLWTNKFFTGLTGTVVGVNGATPFSGTASLIPSTFGDGVAKYCPFCKQDLSATVAFTQLLQHQYQALYSLSGMQERTITCSHCGKSFKIS